MQVLEAIRHMCEESGQKMADVSRTIGRHRTVISNMLTRGMNPQTDTLIRIADACGYKVVMESQDTNFELEGIHESIRYMCEESEQSISEVSQAIGHRRPYISNLLSRGSVPRVDTLIKIANACGFNVVLEGQGERIALEPTDGSVERRVVKHPGKVMTPQDAIAHMREASGQGTEATPDSTDDDPRISVLMGLSRESGYRLMLDGRGERIELRPPNTND